MKIRDCCAQLRLMHNSRLIPTSLPNISAEVLIIYYNAMCKTIITMPTIQRSVSDGSLNSVDSTPSYIGSVITAMPSLTRIRKRDRIRRKAKLKREVKQQNREWFGSLMVAMQSFSSLLGQFEVAIISDIHYPFVDRHLQLLTNMICQVKIIGDLLIWSLHIKMLQVISRL